MLVKTLCTVWPAKCLRLKHRFQHRLRALEPQRKTFRFTRRERQSLQRHLQFRAMSCFHPAGSRIRRSNAVGLAGPKAARVVAPRCAGHLDDFPSWPSGGRSAGRRCPGTHPRKSPQISMSKSHTNECPDKEWMVHRLQCSNPSSKPKLLRSRCQWIKHQEWSGSRGTSHLLQKCEAPPCSC